MKKVLYSGTCGLGDHLQHSTLPRRYSELGYTVYLSTMNCYRNDGIRELVWDKNPYIAGMSNDPPDIGFSYGKPGIYENSQRYSSYIKGVEVVNGLEPLSNYPEIYYKPRFNFKSPIVIDCGAITSHNKYSDSDMLSYLESRNITPADATILNGSLGGFNSYSTVNIFEYCDIIFSSEEFIGYYSGGAVLTSAIQNMYNNCLKNTMLIKSDYLIEQWSLWNFRFDNINGVIL